MLLITLTVLALTMMISAYIFKRPALAISSGILWLLFGLQSLTLSTVVWDIYYDLFIVGIGLFIMGLVESMAVRPVVKDETPPEDYWDRSVREYNRNQEAQNERLRQFRDIMSNKKYSKTSNERDNGEEL
jgi:hypothetical protein